jgi:hypothetical protein
MKHQGDGLLLNAVLVEAAKLPPEQRRTRIHRCVAGGRHDPNKLPFCVAPSGQELARYCDQCWSVIDPHGLTWCWAPQPSEQR